MTFQCAYIAIHIPNNPLISESMKLALAFGLACLQHVHSSIELSLFGIYPLIWYSSWILQFTLFPGYPGLLQFKCAHVSPCGTFVHLPTVHVFAMCTCTCTMSIPWITFGSRSVGATVVEMLTGQRPFHQYEEKMSVIFGLGMKTLSLEKLISAPGYSDELQEFLRMCIAW